MLQFSLRCGSNEIALLGNVISNNSEYSHQVSNISFTDNNDWTSVVFFEQQTGAAHSICKSNFFSNFQKGGSIGGPLACGPRDSSSDPAWGKLIWTNLL